MKIIKCEWPSCCFSLVVSASTITAIGVCFYAFAPCCPCVAESGSNELTGQISFYAEGIWPCAREWLAFIISGIISALLIPWTGRVSMRLYWERVPARRLWRLHDASSCAIVISCRDRYIRAKNDSETPERWITWSSHDEQADRDAVKYQYQNVTGEGQVKALTSLLDSLRQGYGREVGWRNLYFSSSSPLGTIDLNGSRDIILVGGAPTNQYTSMVLQELPCHVDMASYPRTIRYGKTGEAARLSSAEVNAEALAPDMLQAGVRHYTGADGNAEDVILPGLRIYQPKLKKYSFYEVEYRYDPPSGSTAPGVVGKRYLVRDYAIIVRITNEPVAPQGKIYIFAGCTTHGTAMAAEFFCMRAADTPEIKAMEERDYLAVVTMKMMPDGRSWRGMNVVEVIPLS